MFLMKLHLLLLKKITSNNNIFVMPSKILLYFIFPSLKMPFSILLHPLTFLASHNIEISTFTSAVFCVPYDLKIRHQKAGGERKSQEWKEISEMGSAFSQAEREQLHVRDWWHSRSNSWKRCDRSPLRTQKTVFFSVHRPVSLLGSNFFDYFDTCWMEVTISAATLSVFPSLDCLDCDKSGVVRKRYDVLLFSMDLCFVRSLFYRHLWISYVILWKCLICFWLFNILWGKQNIKDLILGFDKGVLFFILNICSF